MIKKALGIFVATTGFLSTIIALLTAPDAIRAIALWSVVVTTIGLLTLLVGPEALRRHRAKRSLPSESDLDDLCSGYRVEQVKGSELSWIAKLEASVYPAGDAIPEHLLREWYAVNPSGFSIIKDAAGRPIGHFDMLPLRPATLEAFRHGDIVEREIRGDSLYSSGERKLVTALYVESIIVRPPKPLTPRSATICLLDNLSAMMERAADLSTLERVYAIAATPAGEKLMRRLGFELEKPGARRKDGHDLFVARASELVKRAATLYRGPTGEVPRPETEALNGLTRLAADGG